MRTFNNTFTLCAAMLLFAGVALAGDKRQTDVSRLKETRDTLAAKASGEKGYPRAQLDLERARVNGLIDQIEAGGRVDPREIDSVLQRADQVAR
jgi:hypothetical protein